VTRRAFRRFRFGIFALLWLGAAALQVYVSDVGTHGVVVGAYLPSWLLALAAIPWWAVLAGVVVNAVAALAALRLSDGVVRALTWINSVLLVLYAAIGVAVLFYIAFANNGIS
jgi:hypothetical protein